MQAFGNDMLNGINSLPRFVVWIREICPVNTFKNTYKNTEYHVHKGELEWVASASIIEVVERS